MTLVPQHKHLQTGIAGSLLIHGVVLALFVTGFSINSHRSIARAKVPPEKEVVLLFPDQLIPPPPALPPPPAAKPKPRPYVRTAQNEPAPKAPAKPAFQSDRNTVAASRKAPAPDGTAPLPTLRGIEQRTVELADRELRDGQLKPNAGETATPPAVPQMRAPQPPAPVQVAQAPAKAPHLAQMMEEMDRESARLQINRLPLEIKKPEPRLPADDAVPPPPATKPAEIAATGTKGDKAAFLPATRTSTIKGTLSNRGQDAVDAERTPMGVFVRDVTGAVEQKWHHYRLMKKDGGALKGSLKVRFYVNRNGEAEDARIISDPRDADPRMADFTMRAIADAEIPPIPDDLLPTLEGQRVKIEYDVVLY